MSYTVGRNDEGTILVVGEDATITLTMNELTVVQLIKLLAATLDNYGIEMYPHIVIDAAESIHSDKGYSLGTLEAQEEFDKKRGYEI
jgi:hypothetical protein